MAKEKELVIKIDDQLEGGIYSNAVSVHVNKNETILDFGYILPNVKPTTIKVMQRVNMSHMAAKSLVKTLSNAMLDFINKQKDASTDSKS